MDWLGACRAGYAQGSGALVRRSGAGPAAPTERFLGRVEAGFLRVGVLVTGQGYVAGRWRDGELAKDEPDDQAQRNVLLAAFTEAAGAADATSHRLARRSDRRASRFYARLAARLRRQLEE